MKMAVGEWAKGVMKLAQHDLGGIGMVKRQAWVFTCPLTNECLGWVGLNRAIKSQKGLLEINPVIGVRYQPLEKLLSDLIGEEFHSYLPPTVSVHLGYLMPQERYTPWLFRTGESDSETMSSMLTAISRFGLKFMHENASLDHLCRTLASSKIGIPEQVNYRLPLAHLLSGQVSKAEHSLQAKLQEMGNRSDAQAEKYRAFALRLAEKLAQNR
jgi:hypothetical protein